MRVMNLFWIFAGCLAMTGSMALAGCAASPRQRPIQGGPVNTGAGSLEHTRRQLEGTWTLTKLEVPNAAGTLVPVRAKAQLSYDAFGNLAMKGVLEEPLPGQATITDAPALVYSGRAVINTQQSELQLLGIDTSVRPDPTIEAAVAASSRRKYTLSDHELVITTVDAGGRTMLRATYTK